MNALFTLNDVMQPVVRALRLTAAGDLTLARNRIDALHRELCAKADWPALRAVEVVADGAGTSIAITNAAGVSAIGDEDGAVYWHVDPWDVGISELAGRQLWSLGQPARDGSDKLVVDVWDWNDDGSIHTRSSGKELRISYWKRPTTLSIDTDKLALPVIRALVVRAILELCGLMDRKDVDVSAWRQELESSMAELHAAYPAGVARQSLRLPSGRVLMRGPAMGG
jgi:hypothetical protein